MQVVRHPNGVWTAIGSVPIGTGIFTVREIMDETPLRREAIRRASQIMAPELRAHCGAAPNGTVQENNTFWRMIRAANHVADALVNKQVREQLAARIAAKIRQATMTASAMYRNMPAALPATTAPAMAGSPAAQNVQAVAALLGRFMSGDATAQQNLLEMSGAVSRDPRAKALMMIVIDQAASNPNVAVRLRSLFLQYGMPKLLQVLDRKVGLNRARVQPRM